MGYVLTGGVPGDIFGLSEASGANQFTQGGRGGAADDFLGGGDDSTAAITNTHQYTLHGAVIAGCVLPLLQGSSRVQKCSC